MNTKWLTDNDVQLEVKMKLNFGRWPVNAKEENKTKRKSNHREININLNADVNLIHHHIRIIHNDALSNIHFLAMQQQIYTERIANQKTMQTQTEQLK